MTPDSASSGSASFTILRSREAAPAAMRGATVAIGNFDGVHLGHRHLLDIAQADAARRGAPSAVLTFTPHPRAFFRPDEGHFRLTGEADKLKILRRLGLDLVVLRPFDGQLAETSARDFVTGLIRGDLGAGAVVVGSNFRFGRSREGTPEALSRLGAEAGLGCTIVPPVEADGGPVSSSRIRLALEQGDVATANRLLGHRWFVSGEIVHGDKRGRLLGYPTANMVLDEGCRLRHGIYAVRIAVAPGDIRKGVASFGRRPTFDDGKPRLETFVFDFSGDLYGRDVEVEFAGWIRGEERFASVEDLVRRMDLDSAEARRMLAEPPAPGASFIG